MDLTHFNDQGRAHMVDVSAKAQTHRVARAAATVRMAPETMQKIKAGRIGKGDGFVEIRRGDPVKGDIGKAAEDQAVRFVKGRLRE